MLLPKNTRIETWILRLEFLRQSLSLADLVCWQIRVKRLLLNANVRTNTKGCELTQNERQFDAHILCQQAMKLLLAVLHAHSVA